MRGLKSIYSAAIGGLPQYTFVYGGEAYFNALKAAGMTQAKSLELYFLSLYDLASAIDSLWADLATTGFNTSTGVFFPMLGDTAAEHALDLISGTSKLTFVGSPTHNSNGVTTNGTTQYISLASPSSMGFTTSASQVFAGFRGGVPLNANSRCAWGSINSTTQRFQVVTSATNILADACTTTGRYSGSYETPSFLALGSDGSNSYISRDATTTSFSRGGTVPTQSLYVLAQNNAGTAQFFTAGTLSVFAAQSRAWNTTEVQSYKNKINSFFTLLSRSSI